MKRSPIFPRDESGGCDDPQYWDLRDDFSKFLEEARKNASEGTSEPELPWSFSEKKKKTEAGGRSWKNSLLFWWRSFEKKGSSTPDRNALASRAKAVGNAAAAAATQLVSRPRLQQGAASGPMPGGRSKHQIRRGRRPASGPLSGCFTPTREGEEEAEVPYMCLGGQQYLSAPARKQDCGPIYLVT